MAYIPPHRRHLKDSVRAFPTPDLLVPRFERNLNLNSTKYYSDRRKGKQVVSGGKIVYATQAISRWWVVGYEDGHFPAFLLEPTSCEYFERKSGEKPLALVSVHEPKGVDKPTRSCERSPWVSIIEKIQDDLQTSVQNMMNGMDLQESEEVKASFVARFGKILFHQRPASQLATISQKSAVEIALSQVNRSFYTNIPGSYVEYILQGIIPKIGVDFEEEKEYYHVKVSDKCRPTATLSCKCKAMKMEGKLELQKVELNPVRQLVVDMSCPEKDLDLRLALCTKKILKELLHEEMDGIKKLIASAIIDQDAKGGLRWPLGKETFGDRYIIVGVWHTKAKTFKNSSMRIKLRDADRFDFIASSGEVAKEASLKLTGINTLLRDGMVEIGPISKLLEDNLKLIWEHFLRCDGSRKLSNSQVSWTLFQTMDFPVVEEWMRLGGSLVSASYSEYDWSIPFPGFHVPGSTGTSTEGLAHVSMGPVHSMAEGPSSIFGFPRWTYMDARDPLVQMILLRTPMADEGMGLPIAYDFSLFETKYMLKPCFSIFLGDLDELLLASLILCLEIANLRREVGLA
ncbi:uncharacterized protein LOC122091534 [Macadamia integrifolia]|uniref:uncharacterized protein LOC122091534 n=1 Tax=Macadamia integrifolia TaxID=60698 RepID=UPI001C4FBB20|nr:uncharacterized protein LOC122091534 [Macadamia integrifolia]